MMRKNVSDPSAGVLSRCFTCISAMLLAAALVSIGQTARGQSAAAPAGEGSTQAAPSHDQATSGPVKADNRSGARITLNDNRVITGPIVKETPKTVWVDLGYTILEIPRDQIKTISDQEKSDQSPATQISDLFYIGSNLPERSSEQQSNRVGTAIVKVATPAGLGSGFIIDPEGYVVTNAHVIQNETKIKCTVWVKEKDGQQHREIIDNVEIVAVNSQIDLALLKMKQINDQPFDYVFIQGSDKLDVGQEVFAIGNPLGLERSLSQGVISTTQRNFDGISYIQTTAQINPGNSGGPLFNSKGEVIGVTNMGYRMSDGLGFAIPARYVRDFLKHREAFAYDKTNPNSGHDYHDPPQRLKFGLAPALQDISGSEKK